MKKRAIVLGGGGARGPYQIGVWKALREVGVGFSIVTGSSVGALNGALMAQGNYEAAEEMWLHLTIRDVIAETDDIDASESARAMRALIRKAVEAGGLDITPLENNLRDALDERLVRESPVELGIVTTRYPAFKPIQLLKAEIPEGELADYLLASSAWFPFFRRKTIAGVDYIDGAYADNLPAELAVRCGAEEIIAVDLQGTGIVHAYRREVPIRYIRSHWNLGDMLVFDPAHARRNLQLGYQDGLKAYRRLEGGAYAFPPGDTRKNIILLRRALDDIRRRTGVSLFKERKRMPQIQDMLRYRGADHRFLRPEERDPTLGRAVTTAAEITGELLQIPPERVYRLREFNKLLLERAAQLRGVHPGEEGGVFFAAGKNGKQIGHRSRAVLDRMLRILREGYRGGRLPDAFWGMAAVSPIEFVAANYLLALEIHYGILD